MEKINYNTLFNLFCDDTSWRNLDKPFLKDGFYGASNGHIFIYIDQNKINLPFDNEIHLNIKNFIPTELHKPVEIKINQLEKKITDKAPLRDVYKYPEYECDECEGAGEIECDLGHMHDCKECNGEGVIEGREPTGKKETDPSATVIFMSRLVLLDYILILIKAAKKLNSNTIFKVYGKENEPFIFQIGDFYIMIRINHDDDSNKLIKIY